MPMCVVIDVFGPQEEQIPIELVLHYRCPSLMQKSPAELHEPDEHERAQVEA